MIEIDNTIVSLDVIEKQFCCNVSLCKGACCVEGDSGAPLENDEVLAIEDAIESISKFLSNKAKELIITDGVAMIDSDGDLVTPLNDNRECVFTVFNKGVAECAIEKSWENKECSLQKPVSCHLYPIRLKQYDKFTAVNYHPWDICKPALNFGKKEGLFLYKFAKPALIRKFGTEWYDQLCLAAEYVFKNKKESV